MHSKEFYSWLFKLLILPCFGLARCPDENSLGPNCRCMPTIYGGVLLCQNIMDPAELYTPVRASEKFFMYSMAIFNSTLRYIPEDLFVESNFEKIGIFNTGLVALSDGDLAFKGLEEHLMEFRADEILYVSQWDFRQLRNLKELEVIDINYIKMETIAEDLAEFPKLEVFGLSHAGLTHISDHIFAKCPQLKILSFHDNRLSILKRSMLPNPALHLAHLDLRKNALEILPDDFFTAMPSLSSIDLSNNKLTTIDDKVFSTVMRYISLFNILGNSIRCDCRIIWFATARNPNWLLGKCQAPAAMKGTSLRYLSPRKLRCD